MLLSKSQQLPCALNFRDLINAEKKIVEEKNVKFSINFETRVES